MNPHNSRSLKIEPMGDFFKKKVKPIIRIKGNWLERAGFAPGHRVQVNCLAPGVMEIRSINHTQPSQLPE